MANTYTQIHLQAVFAVESRQSVVEASWKARLYKYISGIIENKQHKLLAINGMPDHLHIVFGFRPTQSLSDLMQEIKGGSSKWINEQRLTKSRFSWQSGYGAFSYSKSDLPKVIRYVENQEEHHRKFSFTEEYEMMLDRYGVSYDKRYLFKPVDYNKKQSQS